MGKGAAFLSVGPYPMEIGLCLSEKQYKQEMKRRGIEAHTPFLLPDSAATTHIFDTPDSNLVIICLDAESSQKLMTNSRRCGLFAHEAVHALQECHRITREEIHGNEMEAYFVQHITQFCIEQYHDFVSTARREAIKAVKRRKRGRK